MRWLPSGTRSSPASLITRSARTIAGSKRSKLTPGEIVSSRPARAGKCFSASRATYSDTAITPSARTWRRSTKRPARLLATNGKCSVAIHLISSRRASACATHAVAGERAWISETRASRRLAASLRGKVSRGHNAWRLAGNSRCVARSRSRSGTRVPPGEATMAEPPAAITACAASSVARARPPPARVGTICRSVGAGT